ncbi:sialidase family protein [Fulvivirgaceae bacterium BMA10]|uniref:exo-alpha-sialidase n=1 Tax=Splendidivirga corallicola TaxID=3051826 RepID=A0ABT8KJL2_9BACT|nr:sialidase family protein [Fulvivirgaceae bacterium BMA10]
MKIIKKSIICALGFICILSCQQSEYKGMTIFSKQKQIPVLKYKKDNPILRINLFINEGKTLESIQISSHGTNDLDDLKNIRIYYTANDSVFNNQMQYATTQSAENSIQFEDKLQLNPGDNYFWLSYELAEHVDLLHHVDAALEEIKLQGHAPVKYKEQGTHLPMRVGVALRQHMQDEVHTYRIPGLTTTNKGTLLAVYDARKNSSRDLQGDIDIGLSRSIDGGNTWEPMQTIMDMKDWGGLPEKFNGVSDANILVDRSNGDIYAAGLWMYGVINEKGQWLEGLNEDSTAWNHQWRNRGSQPGFGVKQTSQFLITKSTDDGVTWSEPLNLTKMCKKEDWWLWAPAPGNGITMADGTLVMPTQGRESQGLPFSNITYSSDQGKTWTTSSAAYTNTTESAVVELSTGQLMLNMRDNRNRMDKTERNGRAIFTTFDLGKTWTEHTTSHGALQEPVCMASLHKHNYAENGESKSILLFSNPNSKHHRHKMTIKVSFDDGETWPKEYWLLLDEGPGRGYSCLTSIDENTIGILYEGSQADMIFQKVSLKELIGERVN